MGTTANSTKVLTSGKVLRKPIPNPAKQEWIQRRQNKYQRDKRGNIIEAVKDQKVDNLKNKSNDEGVVTRNKFDALELEEIEQPTLMITNGKLKRRSNWRMNLIRAREKAVRGCNQYGQGEAELGEGAKFQS